MLMAPWVDFADVCPSGDCPDLPAQAIVEDYCWLASVVLYELTGRRWPGPATEKLRPCGYRTVEACGCGQLSRVCDCGGYRTVELPSRPVHEVTEVKIDGEVLDPDRYMLQGYALIYIPESETADRQTWPCCQRLDRADDAEGTWSITYSWGGLPPADAEMMATKLARELSLSHYTADGECSLPERITNVTRQGISMAILDPLTVFTDGRTGLSDVDLWLGSMRYGQNHRPARVFAVDRMAKSRTGY